MTETPVASNLDNVDGTSELLDISAPEVANPPPEITAHLQSAPSFNNVLKSSICANTSSKDSLSVVELPDFSFESIGSVSAKYPGRLSWTRKAGDISLMKLVDEPAPFVPSNEALLRSVCIEDMGFTGKTLLNELPLIGSLSKDDLSFSQLPKEVSESPSATQVNVSGCISTPLILPRQTRSCTVNDRYLLSTLDA